MDEDFWIHHSFGDGGHRRISVDTCDFVIATFLPVFSFSSSEVAGSKDFFGEWGKVGATHIMGAHEAWISPTVVWNSDSGTFRSQHISSISLVLFFFFFFFFSTDSLLGRAIHLFLLFLVLVGESALHARDQAVQNTVPARLFASFQK